VRAKLPINLKFHTSKSNQFIGSLKLYPDRQGLNRSTSQMT
jgi:hypothetical protein